MKEEANVYSTTLIYLDLYKPEFKKFGKIEYLGIVVNEKEPTKFVQACTVNRITILFLPMKIPFIAQAYFDGHLYALEWIKNDVLESVS